MNTSLFLHLGSRVDAQRKELRGEIHVQSERIDALRASFDTRIDLLTSKVADINGRIAVLEDRASR